MGLEHIAHQRRERQVKTYFIRNYEIIPGWQNAEQGGEENFRENSKKVLKGGEKSSR